MNQDWEERALLTDPVLDLVLGGGGRIRTCSLQVMGLTSRPITLPRYRSLFSCYVITRLDYYHDPLIPFRQVLITAKGNFTLIASVRSGPDLSERLYPREEKS